MYGVCYSLQSPTTSSSSLPAYEHCFGTLPKDIPFFSLAVPRNYRHEAPQLLAVTSYFLLMPKKKEKKNHTFPPVSRPEEITVTVKEKYRKAG